MALTPSTSSSTPPAVALDVAELTASMAELRPQTLENVPSVQLPAPAASLRKTSRWMNNIKLGRFPPRSRHAAVAVDNVIYSVGGLYGGNDPHYSRDVVDLFVLNVKEREKKWKRLRIQNSEVKPNQRWGHSAVAHNKCVVIFAGNDVKEEKLSNATYSFNTETLKWEQLQVSGVVPLPRSGHSAVLVGHEMYIFGGFNKEKRLTNDLHCLDLNSFCWSTVETKGISPSLRYGHSATVYNERLMLIFGGEGGLWEEELNTTLSFDFNSKTWASAGTDETLPGSLRNHCAFVHNGLMFIYGGQCSDVYFDVVCSFDPETREWEVVEPKGKTPAPREGAGCVAIDNQVFIFGGYYRDEYFYCDWFLDDTHILRL